MEIPLKKKRRSYQAPGEAGKAAVICIRGGGGAFLQPASMQAPKMLSPSFREWDPTCYNLTRFLTKILSRVLEVFLSQAGRNTPQSLRPSHRALP